MNEENVYYYYVNELNLQLILQYDLVFSFKERLDVYLVEMNSEEP
jgi:hypothetical protein